MLTLDADQTKVAKALIAAVDEMGEDYVYEQRERDFDSPTTCWYVWDGKPSCLVGRALADSGMVSLDTLSAAEGNAASIVSPWPEGEAITMALVYAQEAQDTNSTWGESRRVFLETLDEQGVDVSGL